MSFKSPRGTTDILPEHQPYWDYIKRVAADVSRRFGYRRIDTPYFEDTALFKRGVGEETDIVQKEMYSFEDIGGDHVTLRPEGTAPVCRAYIEHGMSSWPQPVRLFYVGPMFRYERPQAGRFRQFHQFGVEVFGDPSPQVDVEVIELAWLFLRELGLRDLTLRVNSIGSGEDRPRHVQALRDYYSGHAARLPKVDRDRLERSPLRLLDSKEPESQALADSAPRSLDFLSPDSTARWQETLRLLEGMKSVYPDLNYVVDHRLVRGLDYYTHTVFEIEPKDAAGQSTLVGGGRYDGLMEVLGGPPTPGVGFAAGLERFILNLQKQGKDIDSQSHIDVAVVHMGEAAGRKATDLGAALRLHGLSAVVAPPGRSMKSQMRFASSVRARYALIIGDRELESGAGALKQLSENGAQRDVPLTVEAIVTAVKSTLS